MGCFRYMSQYIKKLKLELIWALIMFRQTEKKKERNRKREKEREKEGEREKKKKE